MPLTSKPRKLMAVIQCVMRTRAECRGASRTCEFWMVSPGRYADSAIASSENLASGNVEVNIDLNWDGSPERARSYVFLPIPVCMDIVTNTFPSWFKWARQPHFEPSASVTLSAALRYIPVGPRRIRKLARCHVVI